MCKFLKMCFVLYALVHIIAVVVKLHLIQIMVELFTEL